MPKTVSTCELLTPPQLAERLQVSLYTIRRWRRTGVGPAYVRLNGNDVRYRIEDVDAFLKKQTVTTFGGGA